MYFVLNAVFKSIFTVFSYFIYGYVSVMRHFSTICSNHYFSSATRRRQHYTMVQCRRTTANCVLTGFGEQMSTDQPKPPMELLRKQLYVIISSAGLDKDSAHGNTIKTTHITWLEG